MISVRIDLPALRILSIGSSYSKKEMNEPCFQKCKRLYLAKLDSLNYILFGDRSFKNAKSIELGRKKALILSKIAAF